MFTLFDLLKLAGAVTGAVFGGRYGYDAFGWPAAILGVLLGVVAGVLVGNLPWVASWAWMRYDLKRCSVPKLKERLKREYFISHLLIGELVSRGEPLEQFRGHVAALLRSGDAAEHHFGKGAARIWFPDLLPESRSTSTTPMPPPSGNERNA